MGSLQQIEKSELDKYARLIKNTVNADFHYCFLPSAVRSRRPEPKEACEGDIFLTCGILCLLKFVFKFYKFNELFQT